MEDKFRDKPQKSQSDGDSKWLDAHSDPLAALYSFTQCMTLADLHGDGEHKLVIADLGTGAYNMKLKVYKGTSLMSENTIIDLPTGVVTFLMDTDEPRTPAIAVASGSYIYIYKNIRPYFKFTLPPLPVNATEKDIWDQVREDKIDIKTVKELLDGIRSEVTESGLTTRTQRFLMLAPGDVEEFVSQHKHSPLKRQTVITCLDTLRKSMADDDAVSCLVLGSENREIYVLDPEAFTVLSMLQIPSVPVFLSVSGLFDVEFRIIAACRDGNLYTVKRDTTVVKPSAELNTQPVGMVRINKNVVVGCMDQTLRCYTTKGKKLWTVQTPAPITTIELMDHQRHGFKAVLVALTNCQVHLYKDKYLVNVITTDSVITGMKFGRYGREDSTLIMINKGGGLLIKILKRTAQFEEGAMVAGPPPAQALKLNVPKKTKLFVDQTMRERESSVVMHRMFQHDLYRLRLNTAKSYVSSLESSLNPISSSLSEPVKLSAQVQGMGPSFRMNIQLTNTSKSTPSRNWFLSFQYSEAIYKLEKYYIPVSILLPGLTYSFETRIECLTDKGISDQIKVMLIKEDSTIPVITAVISMPVSEGQELA
ncbi:PREDICTED: Bardet-Biedl syndrome 1 protein-like [Priapulus caudatus]|uniref:Bardet-Biedl syndrome 1 protein-like n=1 Tax=Priapulus caudatus TaxID=37621 RepID=A0ABM1E5J1_PRICU|nr:PREDICTED: Bardet-Biedl syndrome 1 protein-like [Priapulus caudatus]